MARTKLTVSPSERLYKLSHTGCRKTKPTNGGVHPFDLKPWEVILRQKDIMLIIEEQKKEVDFSREAIETRSRRFLCRRFVRGNSRSDEEKELRRTGSVDASLCTWLRSFSEVMWGAETKRR